MKLFVLGMLAGAWALLALVFRRRTTGHTLAALKG